MMRDPDLPMLYPLYRVTLARVQCVCPANAAEHARRCGGVVDLEPRLREHESRFTARQRATIDALYASFKVSG